MKIRFIGNKYHHLVHKVALDSSMEAEVSEELGMSLISKHSGEWEEVKGKAKTKPAKVAKKKDK